MKTLCIALAFGPIYRFKDGEAKILTPLDGSIARFDALVQWLTPDPEILITATAGHSKKSPQVGMPKTSLAEQMARYVAIDHSEWLPCLVAKPLVYGTREEIVAGIYLAIQRGFASEEVPLTVRVASNKCHLPRCKLYLKHCLQKGWKYQLVVAHHPFTAKDRVLEKGKLLRDLWILNTRGEFPPVPGLS
jgi:hypothetical protein